MSILTGPESGFYDLKLNLFSPPVSEEMMELFPNLYRSAPATNRPPRTTAHAIETVGRVQTTLPAVMQSLEPRFRGVTRGQAGVAVPHQATRGPLVISSNATPRPALVAATIGQAMSVQTTRSNPLPVVRSSPYPSFNQRQTYFGCCTGRSSRVARSSARGGKYNSFSLILHTED